MKNSEHKVSTKQTVPEEEARQLERHNIVENCRERQRLGTAGARKQTFHPLARVPASLGIPAHIANTGVKRCVKRCIKRGISEHRVSTSGAHPAIDSAEDIAHRERHSA